MCGVNSVSVFFYIKFVELKQLLGISSFSYHTICLEQSASQLLSSTFSLKPSL